jgi:hypothetical protein
MLCLGDGAADYEHGGSSLDCFGRGGDALLVACVASVGADAGDEEEGLVTEFAADGKCLFGGADEAFDAALGCKMGQAEDLICRDIVDAYAVQLRSIHAGEDGDGEEAGGGGVLGGGPGGGAEHGFATAGVKGEEASAKACNGADGTGYGVRDVVKFEVEEDLEAAVAEGLDEAIAGRAVELEADLHPAATAFEAVDEVEGLACGLEVEGYGELFFGLVAEIGVQGAFVVQGHHVLSLLADDKRR